VAQRVTPYYYGIPATRPRWGIMGGDCSYTVHQSAESLVPPCQADVSPILSATQNRVEASNYRANCRHTNTSPCHRASWISLAVSQALPRPTHAGTRASRDVPALFSGVSWANFPWLQSNKETGRAIHSGKGRLITLREAVRSKQKDGPGFCSPTAFAHTRTPPVENLYSHCPKISVILALS
jgi:hypothetical protein